MKATTLNSRLLKSGVSKSTVAYQICKELTGLYTEKDRSGHERSFRTHKIFNGVIRPCYTSGSGRFTSNHDHTLDIATLLTKLKVKFIQGNDAPRGSVTGNWIKIVSKIEA